MKLSQILFQILAFTLAINTANCQNTNKLIPFATGLISPVSIANAGDSRLFAVNQHGYVNIIDSVGNISPQPFLDIHGRIVYGGERGLLGIAFHPGYQANGYFFVNYTGKGDSTHISRFNVSSGNPDMADSQSELKLMTIFQPFENHNGGDLSFGPDGYLYIGLGDGGSGGDPGNRAQNRMQFLGKMLRIDVDHENPYSVPSTNPFYNSDSALGEIWALGLRNPWKFSFDRLTGDLWIADVGQDAIEEINLQPANSKGGENYGWRCYEGNQEYNTTSCPPSASFTFPVYTYLHGDECSVTGGYVYRGDPLSPFYGYYFFADYCSDRIWTLHKKSGNWLKEDFGRFTGNNFSTFGEDFRGQIYIAGITSGSIYRVGDQSTGSKQLEKLADIKIIQDPFSEIIRVETGQNKHSEIHLSVHDIRGTKLYTDATRDAIYELNLSFLPAGAYILTVEIDRKNYIHKLILGK